jgi:D-alanyl-D-alanine carboxypeptidase
MKIFVVHLCIVTALLAGHVTAAQTDYKGGKKHQQPGTAAWPLPGNNYAADLPVPAVLRDSLDKKIRALFNITHMPGITAAVLTEGKGLWYTDTGFISVPTQKQVDSTTIFYWASVAKVITATIIDALVRENKLQYSSRLSTWFPDIQDASKITVDQLLKHTSGIYTFNADSAFHFNPRYYTPAELIRIASSRSNAFPPGAYWSYSNTNYLLLALIAEKTTGKSFAEIVGERIAQPLHLHSLKVLGRGDIPANLALAHANGKVVPFDYSTPLGAGNIAANARDMVILLYSLLSGKVGPPEQVKERLADLYPMFEKGMYYGRGIMLYDFTEINQTHNTWIGHSGGTGNYQAVVLYDAATRAFVAVAVNQQVPAEAVARKLLEQIN